ncbi:MAG: hypothetical protein WDO13_21420 [Verrucomicrobiota bacterium]
MVDPYAISTTLATAGKVNMNYQIVPFTYLTRASAAARRARLGVRHQRADDRRLDL